MFEFLSFELIVHDSAGGFQGCYLDNHRNNWRCARAVPALCENAPNGDSKNHEERVGQFSGGCRRAGAAPRISALIYVWPGPSCAKQIAKFGVILPLPSLSGGRGLVRGGGPGEERHVEDSVARGERGRRRGTGGNERKEGEVAEHRLG